MDEPVCYAPDPIFNGGEVMLTSYVHRNQDERFSMPLYARAEPDRIDYGPYLPRRKYTLRHKFLAWLFPDLAIEVQCFEDAFHRCMKDNRKLEAKIAERADRADEARIRRVDCAIARQLQESIERNSRMVRRLQDLQKQMLDIGASSHAIAYRRMLCGAEDVIRQIVKDEEPTWPSQ